MIQLDTKAITSGNDAALTSKPCHETSPVPYGCGYTFLSDDVMSSLNAIGRDLLSVALDRSF